MFVHIKLFFNALIAEIFQVITWVIMRIAFLLFGKLTVTGLENIKDIKGSVIFAPNHSNDMDPIFLRAALPIHSQHTPLYFITLPFKTYSKIANSQFTAIFYSLVPFGIIGAVPFIRGSGDYGVSLANHINLLKQGRSVCIFPEGKVTLDGKLGDPKGGVTYMAQVTHRPIIPVTISGTFGLTRGAFFTSRPHIRFHFSRPQFAGDIVPTAYPHKVRYHKAAGEILKRIRLRRQK